MQAANRVLSRIVGMNQQISAGRLLQSVFLVSILLIFSLSAHAQQSSAHARLSKEKIATLVLVIDALFEDDVVQVAQPSLALAQSSLDVFMGSTVSNEVTGGVARARLVFTSDNPDIASVDSRTGVVTGISFGTATITVFRQSNRFYLSTEPVTFTVNVLRLLSQPPLVLVASDVDINIGATSFNPVSGGAGTGAILYSSDNPAIATVNPQTGELTGVAAGTTVVTVNRAGDATYQAASPVSYNVTVLKLAQEPLSFALTNLTLIVGNSGTNVASGGSGTGAISYSSSDPDIATVNAVTGEVTAITQGSALISATRSGDSTFLESSTISYTLDVSINALSNCTLDNSNWDECQWQ